MALTWTSGFKRLDDVLSWLALRPRLLLVLLTVAAFGPFLTRPLNIDDPLFVWAARHIQSHPTDPYGFQVNWYGTMSPMWEVTKNPPLACYYLALAGSVFGWSELALHAAMLLVAITAVLGAHRLATRLCGRPVLAAAAMLLTPVFLVSGVTLMCDMLLLAFWLWAVVFWIEGLERGEAWRLILAGVLIAFATLSKYFGAALVPLLLAHGIFKRRRPGPWLLPLLIPVVVVALYQWATHALYGRGLWSDAATYATTTKDTFGISALGSGVVALAFAGGGLAIATFLALLVWRPAALAAGALVVSGLFVVAFAGGALSRKYGALAGTSSLWLGAQMIFWATGGLAILAAAVMDAWRQRDAQSILLALWVGGTFAFAAFGNWIVNGRSLLPLAPAVAILFVRRLERWTPSKPGEKPVVFCVIAGAALALAVVRADCRFAQAARESAELAGAKYGASPGRLWFEGHWGFQYYMEKQGFAPAGAPQVPAEGDRLAIPMNNSNTTPPDPHIAHPWKALLVNGPRHLTTTSRDTGAGFYASEWGPLPFAFGNVPPERVLVYLIGSAPNSALPAP